MLKSIREILKGGLENEEVEINGWIHNKRSSGSIIFFIIRDGSGFLQVTARKSNLTNFEELEKITLESSVKIKGIVKKDERAPGNYEIEAKKIEIYHKAEENFPFMRKHKFTVSFIMKNRHLWLRSKKMFYILTIRSSALKFFREWFLNNGYKEFQSPIITKSACEGGATLFPVNYFGEEAYLTQSWQLYAEAAIASLGKIFTIAPSFRAEKSKTRRHLAEYWHIEAEEPWITLEDLMKIEENLISYVCQRICEENSFELQQLGRDVEEIKKVKPPFERIKYSDVIEILKKKGVNIKFGDDLGADEERIFTQDLKLPVFVYLYPIEIKAFYVKEDENNPGLGLSVDLLAPEGYGEITGGSIREENVEKMKERLKKENLDTKNFEWYFDLRRFGSVPHGGFGLGLERFLMWICKLKHIREAIGFPRLLRKVYP
ncbi:MAG: asparagine--tRNA ligase [Candidatus Aenigmatarchaeota archaeon]